MGLRLLKSFTLAFLLGFLSPVLSSAQSYGLIVHPSNSVDNLSFTELTRILKGDRQYWPSGLRITITLPPPKSAERNFILKRIYQMSEDDYQTFWLGRVFRGEVMGSPLTVPTPQTIGQFVQEHEGVLGFIDINKLPRSALRGIKILRIDGKKPDEAQYPLSP